MGMAENIKRLREQFGLTQEQLGEMLNVKASAIQKYEKGYVENIPRNKIEKMAEIFNVRPSFLMGFEEESTVDLTNPLPVYRIPVFDSVSAGLGVYADSKPVGYEIITLPTPAEAAETMIINVEGDSMFPKIEEGDKIIVHKQTSVDSGSVAVILIDEDDAVVKKIVYGDTWIELHSINPMYPKRIFKGEEVTRIKVLGLVKRVIKEL